MNKNQVGNLVLEKEKLNKVSEIIENKEYFNNMTFSVLANDEDDSGKIYEKFAEVKTKEEFIKVYNSTEKGSLDFEEFIEKTEDNFENFFTSEEDFIIYIDMFDIISILNNGNIKFYGEDDRENINNFLLGGFTMEKIGILTNIKSKLFLNDIMGISYKELEKTYPLLFKNDIDILIKKYNIPFKELENKKEISELNINENSKNSFENLGDEIYFLSNKLSKEDFDKLLELSNEEQIEFLILNYLDVFENILEFNSDYINKNYKVILDVFNDNNINSEKLNIIFENISRENKENLLENSIENGYKDFVINLISNLIEGTNYLSVNFLEKRDSFLEDVRMPRYHYDDIINFVEENFDYILINNRKIILDYLIYPKIIKKIIYSNDFDLKEKVVGNLSSFFEKELSEEDYFELLKGEIFYKNNISYELNENRSKFNFSNYKENFNNLEKYGKEKIEECIDEKSNFYVKFDYNTYSNLKNLDEDFFYKLLNYFKEKDDLLKIKLLGENINFFEININIDFVNKLKENNLLNYLTEDYFLDKTYITIGNKFYLEKENTLFSEYDIKEEIIDYIISKNIYPISDKISELKGKNEVKEIFLYSYKDLYKILEENSNEDLEGFFKIYDFETILKKGGSMQGIINTIKRLYNQNNYGKIYQILGKQKHNLKNPIQNTKQNCFNLNYIIENTNNLDNDLLKKIYDNNLYDLLKDKELLSKILNKITKENIDDIKYLFKISKFLNENLFNIFLEKENKKEFIENIEKYITPKKQKLSQNESIENDEEKYGILYSDILKEVYPDRIYSPKNVNNYEDKTEHLNEYTYDKNGYEIKINGLLGYKLKKIKDSEEFEKLDENMMSFFEKEIMKIKELSEGNGENIINFIKIEFEKNDLKLKTKTLEGNILEYLKNRKKLGKTENNNFNENVEIMNLLISYQLLGKFESFLNSSNDKISEVKGEDSINAVKINALINEYGDNLKDTINLIENNIQNNEDKTDFNILTEEDGIIEDSNEYLNLTNSKNLSKIITKFSKIPDERKNIKMIHKSLKTTFSSNLQKNELLKSKVENLVKKFNILEDFKKLDIKKNKEELIKILENNILEFLNENNEIRLKLEEIQIIQENIYKKLKLENDKFEEIIEEGKNGKGKVIKKYSKNRNIKGYFSKTKENALARGVGDICIGTDIKMWENKNYFEFVLFDEERNQNIGTVMLLNIEENGKKYLLFGPNPSEEFVGKVSAEKLYYKILNIVSDFAENNNFDGIILNKAYGRSTNRGGTFQTVLENSVLREDGKEKIINLDKEHILGGSYSYKDNLNYVWKK